MRNIVLKARSLVPAVAIGLMGIQPAPASTVTQNSLLAAVERARAALSDVDIKLKSVEHQIDAEVAAVIALAEAFDAGEDPEVISFELKVVAQKLDMINETIADIERDLDLIRRDLEEIAKRARRFKSKKLAVNLKQVFAFLEALEGRVTSDKERVDSIRETVNKLADALSSSMVATGNANLRPIGESDVAAKINFVDDGTTLMVTGTAIGLDPAESYLSNIYDIGSLSSGPDACVPTIFDPQDPDFILPTMFLGFWEVDQDGNGKLIAINTNAGADYVPLDKIGTVSIRLFIAPPPAPGAPPVTELAACGPRD